MNILNKLTIKHLLLNKKRTIMSIVGIILSTAMMVGIGLLMSTVRETMIKTIIEDEGDKNSEIKYIDSSDLEIIKNNKQVETFSYYYELGWANYKEVTNKTKPYYYIISASKNYFDDLKLLEGNFPENENEIVLSDHIFKQGEAKYKVGDTITLEYGERKIEGELLTLNNPYQEEESLEIKGSKTYKIVGIVERSFYEEYYYPGFFLYTKNDELKEDLKVSVLLKFKNPEDTIKLTEMLAKNIGKDLEEESNDINYNSNLLSMYGASEYDNLNSFLSTFLTIFLSIISVACIIVIYNSFAISVMERKKQFGLLSSVGATKKQIRNSVFYEATIVGIIGIILGILGGYLGIYIVTLILNNLLQGMIGDIDLVFSVYPTFIIIPIIFIIIVIYISAYLPAYRASKISPIEVIRQNDDIKINKRKIRTSGIVKKLFGYEGEIALKNIKRNKKKYRITIISLFISIVTFMAFYTYLEYGRQTISDYAGETNFDIEALSYRGDKSIIDEIATIEGVEEYLKVKMAYIYGEKIDLSNYTDEYLKRRLGSYIDKKTTDGISTTHKILLLEEDVYNQYKKELGIKNNNPIIYNYEKFTDYTDNNRKIYNTKIYKENSDLSITLETYDETIAVNKPFYTLTNFNYTDKLPKMLDNYLDGSVIFVNKKTYNEIINTPEEKIEDEYQIYINYSESTKLDEFAKKNERTEGFYYANISKEIQMQKNLILAFEILFYGLLTLITLIGVTSVFNTISTSINLRRKEFSVLRSIGLSPKGFNKMIWFESLIFGFKSLLYGLPVGTILSYLISKNMAELVVNNFSLPIKAVFFCIIGVFVVVIVTMWYSTSKIKKENILEAIREENI